MSSPEKMNREEVVNSRSPGGVRIFRVVRKWPDGSVSICRPFTMRVFRDGKRVYFRLPSDEAKAGARADKIAAFLDDPAHSLDDAIRKFHPDRWKRMQGS